MFYFSKYLLFILILIVFIAGCQKEPVSPVPTKSNITVDQQQAEKFDFIPLPFWARTDAIFVLNGYGIIYFYVQEPSIIPTGFNLLTFFDPMNSTAVPLNDWAVDGFRIFHHLKDGWPIELHLEGKGAVPFWFFTEQQIVTALADGVLTMPELESLNPIKGHATKFLENIHTTKRILNVSAKGSLDGGGSFHFSAAAKLHKSVLKYNGKLTLNEN